jgi:hypothetical protein
LYGGELIVALVEPRLPLAGLERDGVLHGRIGLQRHADAQPVVVHPGDRLRSSSTRASPSTIEAKVTSSSRLILRVSSRAVHSGFHSFSNPAAMIRTSSRALMATGRV